MPIPKKSACLLYVDHVEDRAEERFEAACRNDLEGVVANLGADSTQATAG